MKKAEIYTIVKKGQHYDTNDKRFYEYSWECTKDSKQYLEMLIKNDPRKFQDCSIIANA
jgi:hypothetical protein